MTFNGSPQWSMVVLKTDAEIRRGTRRARLADMRLHQVLVVAHERADQDGGRVRRRAVSAPGQTGGPSPQPFDVLTGRGAVHEAAQHLGDTRRALHTRPALTRVLPIEEAGHLGRHPDGTLPGQ